MINTIDSLAIFKREEYSSNDIKQFMIVDDMRL